MGDITQETDWPGEIIGQVSSPSGEKVGENDVLPERGERREESILLTYCGTD